MKKIILFGTLLLLLPFLGYSYNDYVVGNKYINKVTKKCMNGFIYEDGVYETLNYFDENAKYIEIDFTPYSNEYYKIINASKGFIDSTKVEVYHDGHIIKQKFAPNDTTCKETIIGTKENVKPVVIRFYYSKRDANSTKAKVVFILGYLNKQK